MSGTMIALIIPLVLIQLGLMIFALVDLVKRDKVKGGNKVVWALVVILINIIGPIVYLIFGREDE
ncbi:MAG: PLD nuclease N-terminal domain-containing protein [Dehalococcoidia bacterium]